MMNAYAASDNLVKDRLIERLKTLFADKDADVVDATLNFWRMIDDQEVLSQLIQTFVRSHLFQERHFGTLETLLGRFADVSHFFTIVVSMEVNKALAFKFRNIVPYIREKNKDLFDTELVKYLIHDTGSIRAVIHRVFDALSDSARERRFHFDILTLAPKDQFKLFTSILADFHEPKYTLPFILPLVFSPNSFVREVLLTRFELLVEDYGGLVLRVLKAEWPSMAGEQQEVYERIQSYTEVHSNQLNGRCEVKELSPIYTQEEPFRHFMNTMNKHLSRSVNESVKKNSIIGQLATTVDVNKGGGWRISKDHEPGRFSRISHPGLVFPRSYFLDREEYDWHLKQTKFEKWNNILSEWEEML
jgi:hypothetical protein